jgi:hypothetical protein
MIMNGKKNDLNYIITAYYGTDKKVQPLCRTFFKGELLRFEPVILPMQIGTIT